MLEVMIKRCMDFNTPAFIDELFREPVQQLRMCRAGAVLSEVTGGRNDPGAEVPLPTPVDHDTGQ